MLFKQGFWRWVVALVDCLVPSRFWHDGGQVSAVLGVFPLHAHSKALPALGMCRHSMALPKSTQPAFASLSRQGWRTRALPREVPSSAGPVSPGTGAAASSRGYLQVERLWRRTQIHPAPGSWWNFSPQEISMCHPSPSPSAFWTQVFNEWRKTD